MLPNWGFRSTIEASYSDKTVELPLKNYESDKTAVIKFSEFIKNHTPEFTNGFKFSLNPFLFNGALQSLYYNKADYSKSYNVFYGREILTFPSNPETAPHLIAGQTTVDYLMDPLEKTKEEFKIKCAETLPEGYPKLHAGIRYLTDEESLRLHKEWLLNDKPIVVIQHGLAGGSHEPAIRAVAQEMHNKGINVVCLNSRGCCRSPITTPHIYSAIHTDDLRFYINELHKEFPNKQIHLLGFSFGGLIISNYLAEEGENSIIKSAITISSPWDLYQSDLHIQSSWTGRNIFSKAIVFFLTNLIKVNIKKLRENSELFDEEEFHINKKKFKLPSDFDNTYTCKTVGFPTASSYYRIASPINRIFDIKTPMLIINSKDDPLVSVDHPYNDVKSNPYLYMATSDLGGHVAFIKYNGDFWYKKNVANFFSSFSDEIDNSIKPITEYKGYKTFFSYKLPF